MIYSKSYQVYFAKTITDLWRKNILKKLKTIFSSTIKVIAGSFSLIFTACSSTANLELAELLKEPAKVEITENSTIVCFGDSLTYGNGADNPETESWPALLSKRVKIPVINAGVNDNTTEDGVDRFEKDVLSHNPAMVIFDFGGNDRFLLSKFQTYNQIESNFRTMLDQIDFTKTQVYIMRFFNDEMQFLDISGEFNRLLQRLEDDYDIIVIWDAWSGAWGHSDCKYDMSHCNTKGYKIMEANIYKVIKPFLVKNNLLLDSIE